jgi:15-cis-phytoene desaturase
MATGWSPDSTSSSGAYEEIYALTKELGVYDEVLWKEHVLQYTLAGGGRFAFRAGRLPSPLHLVPAITENRYFSWSDKLRLAKSIAPMLFGGSEYLDRQDSLSYEEWHNRFGVGERLLAKMFVPMALALKFVPPAEISAKVVLDVMGMFLRQPRASRMGFLSGSPADKLIGPLTQWIVRRGAVVRTRAKVVELVSDEGGRRVVGVRLRSGERIDASAVILAVPVHRLNRLVRRQWQGHPYFDNLRHFEGVPVISVQLWLDRQVTGIDNVLFGPDGRIPVYADLGNTTPDYRCGGSSRVQFCVGPRSRPHGARG